MHRSFQASLQRPAAACSQVKHCDALVPCKLSVGNKIYSAQCLLPV